MAVDVSKALITIPEGDVEVRGKTGGDLDLACELLLECSVEVEDVLDRKIVTRGTITEFHKFHHGHSRLWLMESPVISIATVHEDATRVYGSATLLVEGTDYIVDSRDDAVKLTRISGDSETTWLAGFEAVRVVWVGGYTQANVPRDIKRVTKEFFASKWAEVTQQLQDQASVSDGLGSRSMFGPAELTSHMIRRLSRHKSVSYGGSTLTRFTVAA